MSAIIQIDGVSKRFGSDVVAVDDVSLKIDEGEFVTLLGPSGCGKTTVLRMVAGFETPDQGKIILGDEDVTETPPYHRHLNMVFQDFALFPHMTVAENVGYGLKVTGVATADANKLVADALKMVELTGEVNRRPNELSGGQRQRAALARALVRKPKVLLLDEPLASLDANLRAALRVELKHLHEKLGLTFLMVTHDQTEALVMADRVVLMHNGKIVQEGTPNEIYEQPDSTYVANFIGTTNLLHGRVSGITEAGLSILIGSSEIQIPNNKKNEQVGKDVTICVRPEKARILESGSSMDKLNTISATVDELLYHGSTVRVQAHLESGEAFLIDVQVSTPECQKLLPQRGEGITIGFNPENAITFPREGSI